MSRSTAFSFFFIVMVINNLYTQPWVEQASGVTVQLTSISCIDNNNDWACGYNGTVLRSATSGNTWINVSGNGIPANIQLVNIFGINSTTALVAGYIGSNTWVYRTSNSGANWAQVFTQTGGFINGLVIRLDGIGFMAGDPVGGRWSLWRTTNNGLSWDSTGLYLPQAGAEAGYNNSIVYTQDRIWFGTNNSRIYHSTNNGTNWSIQTTPELDITAIWFDVSGNATGYAGGNTFLKTTNYGVNWTTLTSMGTGLIVGIAGLMMWSGNIWYIRSGSGNIWYNNGSGFNMLDYTAPAGTFRHITTDRIPNFPYIGFAVRTNGGISYKQIFVQGINNLGGETPESYSLSQNYPNPFNPVTKIRFSVPQAGVANMRTVQMIVYDALGQKIQALVDEDLSPGTYEVDFKAENLQSGVYFYRLTVDGNSSSGGFTETKKMILIK
jgi:photosystem II stability/assembly factor-like uncharacterized protein